jgi:cell division protease FtsH
MMQKSMKPAPGSKPNPGKPEPNPFQGMSIIRIIFIALIIWMIFNYFFNSFSGKNRMDLTYTGFKHLVKVDSIEQVTFTGNSIKGKFSKAYLVLSNSKKDTARYDFFKTYKPPIDDPKLLNLLESRNVTVSAVEDNNSWWRVILISFLPFLLIIGFFVYMGSRIKGNMPGQMGGGIFGIGKSKAKKYRKTEEKTTFDDVAGLENAKKDLQEIVQYLKEPERFSALGAQIPKGILMMGAPGTGKTLLARATAGEANVSFFNISGSEFIEMFVGVGASRVRDMFETAKREAPSIIFIDEIDSIGRARGTGVGGGHDEREQTLNQILSEMDGFEPQQSVVVIAATNRPDVLDSALTRPGRFDRQIVMEMPHKAARREILKIHMRHVPVARDVNLDELAAGTVGFSGADLKNLVNEASLLAGRDKSQTVKSKHFELARDKILLGAEREEKIDDDEKKIIAVHEAGHALIAKLLPETDPLHKVTIIPRGRSLGVTEQQPETEQHNYNLKYLLSRVTVMLGGRSAEKVVLDQVSSGASSDLKQATSIVEKMVCQWGMSEKLGPVYFKRGEEHLFLGKEMAEAKNFSESTAEIIDEEIRRIIHEREKDAISIIEKNRKKLDAISDALLEHETLDNATVDKLLEEN